jgi:hypothetical protein
MATLLGGSAWATPGTLHAAPPEDQHRPHEASLDAADATPPQPRNVSTFAGTWEIRIDAGGEIYFARLFLEAVAGRLQGLYVSDGRRDRLSRVEWQANVLRIETTTRRSSRPVFAVFLADALPNQLSFKGEVEFEAGGEVRGYDFSATRITPLPDAGGVAPDAPSGILAAPAAGGRTSEFSVPGSEASAVGPADTARRAVPSRAEVSFQQGVGGYGGAVDVEIWRIAPDKPLHLQGTMTADANNGGGESQVLMRFGDIFGPSAEQIPPFARIVKAELRVVAFDPGTTVYLHRILVPWNAAATWNSLSEGLSVDDIEASSVRDGFSFGQINMDKQSVEFDVTQTLQAWSDGVANFGWVFVNTGDNGWDFYSSDWIEPELRPQLYVEFEHADTGPGALSLGQAISRDPAAKTP